MPISNGRFEELGEDGDGTGFGLSIVQQIVAGHGWEIQITDSDEGGARFDTTGVN